MSDEEFVRSHWHQVGTYTSSDGYIFIRLWPGDKCWEITWLYPDGAWCAAASFTHDRLEEIRKLEEEILFIQVAIDHLYESCGDKSCGCEDPLRRTIIRLNRELATLRTGMKPSPTTAQGR